MALLTLIIEVLKGLKQVEVIFKYLLDRKWWAILLIIAVLTASYSASTIIRRHYHNKVYDINANYDSLNYFVDKILVKCGERTGISISSISLDFNSYNDTYSGRFYVAKACDQRETNNRCLIDLKTVQPALYASEQQIDLNSYQFLLRLGNQINSASFYLRDRYNVQDLSPLDNYPSIKYIVKNTNWSAEGSLYYLWVTSIISNNNLLYVITYLSGTAIEKSNCPDPNVILGDIKNFLINL